MVSGQEVDRQLQEVAAGGQCFSRLRTFFVALYAEAEKLVMAGE